MQQNRGTFSDSLPGTRDVGPIVTNNRGLNDAALAKVEELRADFERVTGKAFETFYCPILFRDDNVELCRAHVINRAFRESHRGWTIQRSDVDSFYGSVFEADFLSLQDHGRHDPVDVLGDRRLSRRLRPSITVEDDEVEHYLPTGLVPDQHSKVVLETPEGTVDLALKMQPSELLDRAGASWEIRIDKDVRLPAIASVLKAAHLTLFDALGYAYALSAGGYFLGRKILGDFFDAHHLEPRADVLEAGEEHFPAFANMVRPIVAGADHLQGTASDGRLYFCGAGSPWAIVVIVRMARARHAVVVPVFDGPIASAHFFDFLDSETSELAVRLAELKQDRFEVSRRVEQFHWPAANYHTVDS
jgi:hypothetical protein